VFLSNQASEWLSLGFTPSTHAYGSIFYLLTGFHGVHVLGGVLAKGAVLARMAGRTDDPGVVPGVQVVGYYWHFVDVVVDRRVRHGVPGQVVPRGRAAALLLLLLGGLFSVAVTTLATASARQARHQPRRAACSAARRCSRPAARAGHGPQAQGTGLGPSLLGVGAASVDFWLSTGRMPLKTSGRRQAVRKPPEYDRGQIDDLIAYVTSLDAGGPPNPRPRRGTRGPGRRRRRVPQ